jgi:ATP-binding cassette subfamily F protein 3
VVKSEDVAFGYGGENLFSNIDFEIERGDKIGLFGPNGSGKTTLLNLIMGKLKPKNGNLETGKKLSIGYYDQLSEDLNQDSTPVQVIKEKQPLWTEGQIRGYLGKFLFSGEHVFRKVRSFSGGEQSRLALAKLIVTTPNFLVLDEPTNHLDILSREALEEALIDYEGTVLCVSHDRYFLDRFAERIFSIDKNTVTPYLGNYSDYIRKKESVDSEKTSPKARAQKPKKEKAAKLRINPQIIQKMRDEAEKIEKDITVIEDQIANLESSSDWEKLNSFLNERDKLYSQIEEIYLKIEKMLDEKE